MDRTQSVEVNAGGTHSFHGATNDWLQTTLFENYNTFAKQYRSSSLLIVFLIVQFPYFTRKRRYINASVRLSSLITYEKLTNFYDNYCSYHANRGHWNFVIYVFPSARAPTFRSCERLRWKIKRHNNNVRRIRK